MTEYERAADWMRKIQEYWLVRGHVVSLWIETRSVEGRESQHDVRSDMREGLPATFTKKDLYRLKSEHEGGGL